MISGVPFLWLSLLPPLRTQAILRGLRWRLPLLAWLVASIVATVTRQVGSHEFYGAVAQILPVLLLALAIDMRSIVHGPARGLEMGMAMFVFLVLGLAEYSALHAVDSRHASNDDFSVVVGALAASFVAIVTLALTRMDDSPSGNERTIESNDLGE